MELQCCLCRRKPSEIQEYTDMVNESLGRLSNEAEAVLVEEGTLNPQNALFACTECYIKLGMPTAPGGWIPRNKMR